ncbi:MAG: diphthamide synthesis protein, partial [Candidatus Diapherotrites archaeon]|nr:diphthamide synthesis protein [Candidatus Diapherotrites archaeon]
MIDIKKTIAKIIKIVKREKAKIVAIQIPEGLKTSAAEIVNSVEKNTKARVLLFVDPCYGACDVRDEEAKRANCDLLIHVGHRPFLKNHCMKVIYVDVESKFNKSKIAAGID